MSHRYPHARRVFVLAAALAVSSTGAAQPAATTAEPAFTIEPQTRGWRPARTRHLLAEELERAGQRLEEAGPVKAQLTVRRRGRRYRAALTLVEGDERLERHVATARGPGRAIRSVVEAAAADLATLNGRHRPSPAAAEEPGTDTADTADTQTPSAAGDEVGEEPSVDGERPAQDEGLADEERADLVATRTAGRWLELRAGARMFRRELSYHDDLFAGLRSFTLRLAPGMVVGGEVRPLRLLADDSLSLGVTFEYARAFGIDADRSDGHAFPTRLSTWHVAAIAALRTGRAQWALAVGVGELKLVIDPPANTSALPPEVPGVRYRAVRVSGRAAIDLAPRFGVVVSGSYARPWSLGGIEDPLWFPNASAHTVGGRVAIRYRMWLGLAAEIGVSMRRTWMDLDPEPRAGVEPGTYPVAGGALDRQQMIDVALLWVH